MAKDHGDMSIFESVNSPTRRFYAQEDDSLWATVNLASPTIPLESIATLPTTSLLEMELDITQAMEPTEEHNASASSFDHDQYTIEGFLDQGRELEMVPWTSPARSRVTVEPLYGQLSATELPGMDNIVRHINSRPSESERFMRQDPDNTLATWKTETSSSNTPPIIQNRAGEGAAQSAQSLWTSNTFPENLLDKTAVHLCTTWLLSYAGMPKERHFKALGCLTGLPASAIERWFGAKLRSNGHSTYDSGVFTGSAGPSVSLTHDSGFSLTTGRRNNTLLNNPRLPSSNNDTLATQNSLSHATDLQQDLATDGFYANDQINAREAALAQEAGQIRSHSWKRCRPTSDENILKRDPRKPFQCTLKCGKTFTRGSDWKRHEESRYPPNGWVCLLGRDVLVDGLRRCAYCYEANPSLHHMEESHKNRFKNHGREPSQLCKSYHYRKTHFQQHFEQVHPGLQWRDYEQESCFEVKSRFPRYCGFCVRRFETWTWEDRYQHIYKHFKDDKLDMRQWVPLPRDNGSEHNNFHRQKRPDPDESDDNDSDNCDDDGGLRRPFGSGPRFGTDRGLRRAARKSENSNNSHESPQSSCRNQTDHGHETSLTAGDQQPKDPYSNSTRHNVFPEPQPTLEISEANGVHPCEAKSAVREVVKDVLESLLAAPSIVSERNSSLKALEIQEGMNDNESGIDCSSLVTFNPESFLSLKLLGFGSFGVVDSVLHHGTGSVLARKTMTKRKDAKAHFANEVQALLAMRHPHILRLVGLYTLGPTTDWMLLYPVADMDLSEFIETPAPTALPSTRLWGQLGCLADALDYIHSGYSKKGESDDSIARVCGCHMDLKPSNILVFSGPMFKISDFGLAYIRPVSGKSHIGSENHQRTDLRPGTRAYQPPEAPARYKPSRAYDVWSLGCIFLEVASFILHGSLSLFRELRDKHFRGKKFYDENIAETHEWLKALQGYSRRSEIAKIEIIKAMLNREPRKRPTARQICDTLPPGPCCWSELNLLEQEPSNQAHKDSIKTQHPANQDI